MTTLWSFIASFRLSSLPDQRVYRRYCLLLAQSNLIRLTVANAPLRPCNEILTVEQPAVIHLQLLAAACNGALPVKPRRWASSRGKFESQLRTLRQFAIRPHLLLRCLRIRNLLRPRSPYRGLAMRQARPSLSSNQLATSHHLLAGTMAHHLRHISIHGRR